MIKDISVTLNFHKHQWQLCLLIPLLSCQLKGILLAPCQNGGPLPIPAKLMEIPVFWRRLIMFLLVSTRGIQNKSVPLKFFEVLPMFSCCNNKSLLVRTLRGCFIVSLVQSPPEEISWVLFIWTISTSQLLHDWYLLAVQGSFWAPYQQVRYD